jgi:hypothetical protein
MYTSKQLTMIVARAAHHLHASVGGISTALLDIQGNGKILFSNSVLGEVHGSTLVTLARDLTPSTYPAVYQHTYNEYTAIYFVLLDSRHVFTVIGKAQDAMQVEDFTDRLKRLLPVN